MGMMTSVPKVVWRRLLWEETIVLSRIKTGDWRPWRPRHNAIFGAVKAYEKLVSKGYDSEVALVAGKRDRGEADEKIGIELNHVLNRYHADAARDYFWRGGWWGIVAVIQTMIPVISVQRIIIKHSRSVEYSYAVLGRYIKCWCTIHDD